MLPEIPQDMAQTLRDRVGLVSEAQFSAMMSVSEYSLQSWRALGTGPRFVKLGRAIYYRLKDIEAWIASNTHESTRTTGPNLTYRDSTAEELNAAVEVLASGEIAPGGA